MVEDNFIGPAGGTSRCARQVPGVVGVSKQNGFSRSRPPKFRACGLAEDDKTRLQITIDNGAVVF